MNPLVSIGMPVFNCEATLKAAVQSILNQTYSHWELILIDDGSGDKTPEIAQGFEDSRIRFISDGVNRKLPNRLNQAIMLSRGKYFARMDGDDISYPERLKCQVDFLESQPRIDLLGTQTIVFRNDGEAMGMMSVHQSHSDICRRPWSGFCLSHPTWMGRLEWFRKYQYRTDAIRMEDYDLLLRSYKASQFACLPDVLLGYRIQSLSLKSILIARYNNSFALSRSAVSERNLLFSYGVLKQVLKAIIDSFAISTGLNLKLLNHRVGCPVPAPLLDQWRHVWNQCHLVL